MIATDCARCDEPIDPERVEALPGVEYCQACQGWIERRRATRAAAGDGLDQFDGPNDADGTDDE